MADPKYRGVYLALRAGYAAVVARGEATCQAPTCLMPTRSITPGARWVLIRDDTDHIRGPAHSRCGKADATRRGNATRPTRFLKL